MKTLKHLIHPAPSSVPDDSDTEFVPTPPFSPGGPTYDDLPPSYDEAQQQARSGVTPLDPDQLEAHRLTLNEGPNEPEIWEYRLRGEQLEHADEHEPAPEYGRTVPIEHIQNSDNIPVGRTGPTSTAPVDPATTLLTTALHFARHEPDADAQYAPRLARAVAIPQQGPTRRHSAGEKHGKDRRRRSRNEPSSQDHTPLSTQALQDHAGEPVQFLRAYAKALHPHSIRPAEFTEFLDGLNILCEATNTSADDLLHPDPSPHGLSSIVSSYINGANETFFAPRGLRVSLQPLSTLLENLNIPSDRRQRSNVLANVLNAPTAAEGRAQALYPWIETLETNVPSQSSQALSLQEMSVRLLANYDNNKYPSSLSHQSSAEQSYHREDFEDPPHSLPEDHGRDFGSRGRGSHGHRGRGGRRGGPWGSSGPGGHGPFGPHGYGPFGPHGHGPFGPPGNGPFGPHGQGPFGPRGHHGHHGHGPFGRHSHGHGPGPFGPPNRGHFGPRGGFGPHGSGPGNPPHFGRGGGFRRPGSTGNANDWQAWGEQIGKWGEEFGKRMEDWGQQFGKRAENWGQDVGRSAEAWGQDVAARASGSGSRPRNSQGPVETQYHDHHPPPPVYPEGSSSQETGVIREKDKAQDKTVEKDEQHKTLEKRRRRILHLLRLVLRFPIPTPTPTLTTTQTQKQTFAKRVKSINEQADAQLKKGKKSPQEIEAERNLAIKKAELEKQTADHKIEAKQAKTHQETRNQAEEARG